MTGREDAEESTARADDLFDFCPWRFAHGADRRQRDAQSAWQQELIQQGTLRSVGPDCYVSRKAALHLADLAMGADSYVAASVYLTGEVTLGAHCTLNPYAVVRGQIRMGDGVRVASNASLLGFNHGTDPGTPIYTQRTTSRGIDIGDDVWIGSAAQVLDGVRIGSHSIIGAGAVVTKDVPEWSVMVGNPARRIRDRRSSRPQSTGATVTAQLPERLAQFGQQAREQARALLDRAFGADDLFADRPGCPPSVRAQCDAVEIAAMLLGGPPPQVDPAAHRDRLRSAQDPGTGLVPEFGQPGPVGLDHQPDRYHILSVGYALSLLGSNWPAPIAAVAALDSARLVQTLDSLPWERRAWSAGDWIDAYATGLWWNQRQFSVDGPVETLFGWLLTRHNPISGLWGEASTADGWLQPVNGFYRLTRGSFAQFGLPLPRPEAVIDTVLAHSRDTRHFGGGVGNACNVLDVAHPLWLCGRQTPHRRADAQAWAAGQLDRALPAWQPQQGFSFGLRLGVGRDGTPGLMGTEMWLSIIWLLADLLGDSDALGYRPQGVHRPDPPQ